MNCPRCHAPVPVFTVEIEGDVIRICPGCGANLCVPKPKPEPTPSQAPATPAPHTGPDDLQAWFEAYHAANPHVYEAFCEMAREIRAQGHRRYGAKTIMERLRWESPARYPDKAFKLGNNVKDRCSARYARLLVSEDSSFASFFELRPVSTAEQRAKLSQAHRGGPGRVSHGF